MPSFGMPPCFNPGIQVQITTPYILHVRDKKSTTLGDFQNFATIATLTKLSVSVGLGTRN